MSTTNPKQANYPPPPLCTEYRVLTECQRNLIWSAVDLTSLMRELTEKGYRATLVMENSEYEAMEEREQQDKQREWNWKADLEKEGRTA